MCAFKCVLSTVVIGPLFSEMSFAELREAEFTPRQNGWGEHVTDVSSRGRCPWGRGGPGVVKTLEALLDQEQKGPQDATEPSGATCRAC